MGGDLAYTPQHKSLFFFTKCTPEKKKKIQGIDQKTKVTQRMSSGLNNTARIKTIYSTKSQEQKNKILKKKQMSSSFFCFY